MITMFVNRQRKYETALVSRFQDICQKACDAVEASSFLDRRLRDSKIKLSATVYFVSSEFMKKTNRQFRNINSTTDVLSFPLLNMKNGKLAGPLGSEDVFWHKDQNGEVMLGDIFISLDKVKIQAEELGHDMQRELYFLTVHSVLHLLGFDHIEPVDEKKMTAEQRRIMKNYQESDDNEIALEAIDCVDNQLPDNQSVQKVSSTHELLKHSGFVAIIGRPNVGKSTLLNHLAGVKLAITSHKPQTTRNSIRAIVNTEDGQIIFIDTPGIHRPKNELSRFMMDASLRSTKEADVILLMADGRFERPSQVERDTVEFAKNHNKKIILAINKSDYVEKEQLLPTIKNYSTLHTFSAIVPISAKTGDGLDVLIREIMSLLPEGPQYYPEEIFTDQTVRDLAAELIREQILRFTHQEIPHGTAVMIDKFEEADESLPPEKQVIRIYASVICERDSHKAIILGKGGLMIKRIGSSARSDIEMSTGHKVYLEIHVKVRPNWQNMPVHLKELGYRKDDHL